MVSIQYKWLPPSTRRLLVVAQSQNSALHQTSRYKVLAHFNASPLSSLHAPKISLRREVANGASSTPVDSIYGMNVSDVTGSLWNRKGKKVNEVVSRKSTAHSLGFPSPTLTAFFLAHLLCSSQNVVLESEAAVLFALRCFLCPRNELVQRDLYFGRWEL